MKRVYLDYAATTPVDKEVLEEMLPYFSEKFGNASSAHSIGKEAAEKLEECREKIAKLMKVSADEIYFTSGGTESDNFAIKGIAYANKGNHLVTSKIEHPAVLQPMYFLAKRGYDVSFVGVDKFGLMDKERIRKAIRKGHFSKTVLCSVMYANNEVGTIEPISEIAEICSEKEVYFHTDAVQAFGKIPLDLENVDLLSASSHKLNGPKGVGLIYIKEGTKIERVMQGGSQEKKMRSGTINLAGIVGFAKAVEIAYRDMEKESKREAKLRDKLIKGLLEIPDSYLNGHPIKRLPNNVNVSFKGVEGEALLLMLDQMGICASTGSACSSHSLKPSHVITALYEDEEIGECGLSSVEKAHSSIRFTLGKYTTKEDIEYAIEKTTEAVEKLRKITALN